MNRPSLVALCAFHTFFAWAAMRGPGQAHAAKPAQPVEACVLLLGYQPIFGALSMEKAESLTSIVHQQLSKAGQVVRRDTPKTPEEPPAHHQSLVEAAQKETLRDFDAAILHYQHGIADMVKHPKRMVGFDPYLSAHHHLARALMWRARDDESKAILRRIASMNGPANIDPKQFSPLYRRWLDGEKSALFSQPPGTLVIQSQPPGAIVVLDGRPLGAAPLEVRRLVPGPHFVEGRLPKRAPTRQVVDVKAGTKTDLTLSFAPLTAGPSAARLARDLAQNRLQSESIHAARESGQAAGCTHVVFGGIAQAGPGLMVHTFVLAPTALAPRSLPVAEVDAALLTAASDLSPITRAFSSLGAPPHPSQTPPSLPFRVNPGLEPPTTIRLIDASPAQPVEQKKTHRRRTVFRPFGAGGPKIKD